MSWIPEAEAAKIINRSPRVLRTLAKSGELDIQFTSVKGRSYQYNEQDLQKALAKNASPRLKKLYRPLVAILLLIISLNSCFIGSSKFQHGTTKHFRDSLKTNNLHLIHGRIVPLNKSK